MSFMKSYVIKEMRVARPKYVRPCWPSVAKDFSVSITRSGITEAFGSKGGSSKSSKS